MTVRGSVIRAFIHLVGFGVVVATTLGQRAAAAARTACCPRPPRPAGSGRARRPRRSRAPGHGAGPAPRRRSPGAMQPLGQVSFFFDGSHRGRLPGGEVARMPETPSTIVSRRSGPVAAIRTSRGTWLGDPVGDLGAGAGLAGAAAAGEQQRQPVRDPAAVAAGRPGRAATPSRRAGGRRSRGRAEERVPVLALELLQQGDRLRLVLGLPLLEHPDQLGRTPDRSLGALLGMGCTTGRRAAGWRRCRWCSRVPQPPAHFWVQRTFCTCPV